MFTGIVEELGSVESILEKGGSLRLEIGAKEILLGLKVGDSVSVNGVCLTIVEIKEERLFFECMEETIRRTNLGRLKIREKVNLERALRLNSFLSGHIVLGHIDAIGRILKKNRRPAEVALYVKADKEIMAYLVPKGSVALDGVSLTVVETGEDYFSVNLIPHTLRTTTLGFKEINDYLNIELDILAKYVKRILFAEKRPLTEEFLREQGFML